MLDKRRVGLAALLALVVLLIWGFAAGLHKPLDHEPQVVSAPPKVPEASSSGYRLADEQIGTNLVVQQDLTGEAAAWGDNVKIPADFPSEIPQYPNAQTKAALITPEGRAQLVQVTDDSIDVVAGRLVAEARAKGFTLASDVQNGAARALALENSQWLISVTLTPNQKTGTVISSTRVDKKS